MLKILIPPNNARFFTALLFLTGVCLLYSSCSTTGDVGREFDSEAMQRGGVFWQHRESKVKFEGVFSRSTDGRVALDLYKGGASPVATLRMFPDGTVAAEGPAVGRKWTGPQQRAPQAIRPLIALAALYGKAKSLPDGIREIHTTDAKTAIQVVDGRLKTASVASQDVLASASVRFW